MIGDKFMRKSISKLFFILITLLFSLSLLSCGENEIEKNYVLISEDKVIELQSDNLYIKTDATRLNSKKVEIFSKFQICIMDRISNETIWEKNGSNDLSNYNQQIKCSVYRRLYVGEVKYLLDPINEKKYILVKIH